MHISQGVGALYTEGLYEPSLALFRGSPHSSNYIGGLQVPDHNHLFFNTFCFQKTTNLGHAIFLDI